MYQVRQQERQREKYIYSQPGITKVRIYPKAWYFIKRIFYNASLQIRFFIFKNKESKMETQEMQDFYELYKKLNHKEQRALLWNLRWINIRKFFTHFFKKAE